jgi:hypothetical protein
MKISELLQTLPEPEFGAVSSFNLLDEFEIWTTIDEAKLLKKLVTPVKLSSLNEQDQFRVQAMIRKSLVTKIGHNDPMVVANEKI